MLPLINLAAEYKEIKEDIDKAVLRVLQSGWFILGREVEEFEKEFAKYIGVKHAVGVASGTDALTLSIKALGLGKGDGVVVPANVYPTAFGVALSGAKLELCDVDPHTLNVSAKTLEKAVTPKTRAVVVVHLYGNPVDIAPIQEFCKKRKLYLIEDCAQACGAEYGRKKVGTFGDMSCFSFYPTKTLGAYGDGGAILTSNKEYAKRARMLRMYGEVERYESKMVGHNSRLDELQASILRVKLRHLDVWIKKRRRLAKIYGSSLKDLPIKILDETNGGQSAHYLFVVQVKQRERLTNYLEKNGVQTGVHYPTPIHLARAFPGLGYKRGNFPVSEEAARSVLSLPLYPQMGEDDVEYVGRRLKEFYAR